MWRQLGQQHLGLVSRRVLLGARRGGCYAQTLVVPNRHHGTSSSALTRLLLDRETASTPQKGEAWKWYACGPTVYDSAHLGHARTYVCQDIIRRVLTDYFRQDIMFVMGVTDVDDKILRRATERYERGGEGGVW
jgi:cysteinyl-tRNA synthetase